MEQLLFGKILGDWKGKIQDSLPDERFVNSFRTTNCPTMADPDCASGDVCAGPFCFDRGGETIAPAPFQ